MKLYSKLSKDRDLNSENFRLSVVRQFRSRSYHRLLILTDSRLGRWLPKITFSSKLEEASTNFKCHS